MKRRHFNTLLGGSLIAGLANYASAQDSGAAAFKAKFAPHPDLLPGTPKPYLEQLQFAYDHGFRAWEDNKLGQQTPEVQEQFGAFMKEKGMTPGVAVITGGAKSSFLQISAEAREEVLSDVKKGVEVAKRAGLTHMTFVPGIRAAGVPLEKQIAGAVDLVKHCCDIVEEHGIILVQEPISHKMGGGDPLLRSFDDGFMLCELVNRKSCKLLADFFHEGEIGFGDQLLANAEKVWSQVAYVQYGDSPGRKEPGTGKLDLAAVSKWLRGKNYTGVIGMEHGASEKGAEGLAKLIAAYRGVDA